MSASEKKDISELVELMHKEGCEHLSDLSEDELYHYGVARRSGRYPWGSGEDPYQHSGDFLARVEKDRKAGKSEKQIADDMKLSVMQLRTQIGLATSERRLLQYEQAKGLSDKGYGATRIAEMMSTPDKKWNESSIRSLLNQDSAKRMNAARNTADHIKDKIESDNMMFDVGKGVEKHLGVSRDKLNQALYMLELEGYPTYKRSVQQATNPGQQTHIQVVCPKGTEYKEIYNTDKIGSLTNFTSSNDGETFHPTIAKPSSLDSKRVAVRYAEDGGINKDGVIEIRRGVKDVSIGDASYAQVRIMVDNSHYLKGMAVYSDNLPKGVDVLFNTNKKKGTPMCGEDKNNTVLKKIKTEDPDNPFGALISYQHYYTDSDGKEKLGVVNRTRDEGDWARWADKLPSQFLGKQNIGLINRQLGMSIADKQAEFDAIRSLNNPTVKKQLLETFANDCDSAAVHLKAASLPRQKYQVLLPLTSIKDNEVYAPNYNNGEKVALVRYPHGGTFEIPILTVNNNIKEGQRVMGKNAKDAIGINAKVAERLSGADFDGDTAMVIPTNSKTTITNKKPLKDLEGFDPKMAYPARDGMKIMKNTNIEMGKISNLITDMTLKGAKEDELARAVKHSMCVIDAEKHKLDYKRSEIENDIASLKKKYQAEVDPKTGKEHAGAGTILSRAKGIEYVEKRVGTPKINQKGKDWYDPSKPEGSLIYKSVREEYIDRNGKVQVRTQTSTRMAEATDAMELVSKHRNVKEIAYANYANKMKAMANEARKTLVYTGKLEQNKEAKVKYSEEVKSLSDKLLIAEMNAPRERRAQILTNARVEAKTKNLDEKLEKSELKKLKQRELQKARAEVGAKRETIDITDKEWEAIQAGAISESKLKKILNNADIDKVRELATPRQAKEMTQAKINRIAQMKASGYTNAEIAKAVGCSASTVSKYL